jgi:hypothetical protein
MIPVRLIRILIFVFKINNTLSVQSSQYTFNIDSTNTLLFLNYELKIIDKQLKNINVVIQDTDDIRNGLFVIPLDAIGKSYFKDDYIDYHNIELSRLLPKPQDIWLISRINY